MRGAHTTRVSLLRRLRDPGDHEAWKEFYRIYAPLLYRYARLRGLSRADALEVRDECLAVVARRMPTFVYDQQKGGFKNWLRRIAENKVIDSLRKRREKLVKSERLRNFPDPEPPPSVLWERHWGYEHLKACVERVRGSVSDSTYQAFHLLVIEECSPEEVCRRLNLNANQVYKAKSRVLARVRRKMAELGVEFI